MWKKILSGFLLLILLVVGAFVAWGSTPAAPMPQAFRALESDSRVVVENGDWLVFRPAKQQPDTGYIFYPGGRVDYRAYAPYARAVAEQGFLVVIVPMPLNLAVMAPDRAGEVIQQFPSIRRWAIGGHSLGGAMAARYAYLHEQQVDGVVLVASYPAESNTLQDTKVPVLSVYATNDGLATTEKITASHNSLPQDTVYYAIEGGNHAQFGWYGPQEGDLPATVSRAEQQEELIEVTLEFLDTLSMEVSAR